MTKEELKKLRYLDIKLSSLQRQLHRLHEQKLCIQSMDYSKDRVQQSSYRGIADIVAEIVDLENKLLGDMEELLQLKRKARESIQKIPGVYGAVLELRYLEHFSWSEISYTLGYSIQGTYKIHGEALRRIKRVE